MNEIKCPHCGKTFKIDEASFAAILKQVRDGEFEKELHARIDSEVRAAEAKTKLELQTENSKKEAEIAELRAKLDNASTESRLAVAQALSKVEKERDELAVKLSGKDAELKASESSLKERYEIQIKDRDDAIERLKDMKSKLSVKLVGENLEQHCQNEFNGVRASLFPFAYFEKDNEAIKDDDEAKGTKGDYIYKDYDSQGGTEIISIMFEMKDEQDVSTNKRTVESHLDKLDKDRKKKGLEYAVLVTLLEADNELYNRGIVDVSYKYEKMYVIRPQFFLPLISLLKSANMKAVEAKRQLMVAQSQNVDITTFENDMNTWKDGWLRVMKNAGSKHVEGIEQINKAIKDLEKARDALMMSDKHLLTAENKMDDLTIKRLTRKNPTMAKKFEELDKAR
ncbi:MAG TPA: DUF2130 domain-containing protein [Candidatus Saccharibacteria bacterium]|nr:DUF2130 domain-containing protein [Candidatus Saccharibacteria bacterium]HMR72489.1 DUF2130 domain-containing protein [Candidatus Saccharibacteria bacterium]